MRTNGNDRTNSPHRFKVRTDKRGRISFGKLYKELAVNNSPCKDCGQLAYCADTKQSCERYHRYFQHGTKSGETNPNRLTYMKCFRHEFSAEEYRIESNLEYARTMIEPHEHIKVKGNVIRCRCGRTFEVTGEAPKRSHSRIEAWKNEHRLHAIALDNAG